MNIRTLIPSFILAAALSTSFPALANVTFTFNPGTLMSLPPQGQTTLDGDARIISRFVTYDSDGWGNYADIEHTGNTYIGSDWAQPQPLGYDTYSSWLDGLGPNEGIASFNIYLTEVIPGTSSLSWGQVIITQPPDSGVIMTGTSDGGWNWSLVHWGTDNQPGTPAEGYAIQWWTTNNDLRLRPGVQLPDFSFTAPVQVFTEHGLEPITTNNDYIVIFESGNRPTDAVNFPDRLEQIKYDNNWGATTNTIRGPWASSDTDFWQANTSLKATTPIQFTDATGGNIDNTTPEGQASALNITSGNNALTSQISATNIRVAGGSLQANDNTLTSNTAVTVTPGASVILAGTNTIGGFQAIGGTTTINGSLHLTGNNNGIFDKATVQGGPIHVDGGRLLLAYNPQGNVSSDIHLVGANARLGGSGTTTGTISGSGRIQPGASPGIMTVGQINLSYGLGMDFEFGLLGGPNYADSINSGNDVLRIVGPSFFDGTSFTSLNDVAFYFNEVGYFEGGIFLDGASINLAGLLSAADLHYYIANPTGTINYNGNSYSELDSSLVTVTNAYVTGAAFESGSADGTTLAFSVVPEPGTWLLLAFGAATTGLFIRRKKN